MSRVTGTRTLDKRCSIDSIVEELSDGMTIAIGGWATRRKPMALIKRLRKAKAKARPMERPEGIKTHLRNMIIVPEMIGSVVGIYNGKVCVISHSGRWR